MPAAASMAGSSVIEASTVNTTATAAPMARPYRNSMPVTNIPRSASTTTVPANTTARPDVASAATIDSRTGMPLRRFPRCRFTMNSA